MFRDVAASLDGIFERIRVLTRRDKPKAAYELQKCIATRKALGFGVTREMQQLLQQLSGVQPAPDAEQQEFYKKMIEKYNCSGSSQGVA